MTYKQFGPLPPDTRAAGTPNPPGDADVFTDALAVRSTFSCLNKAYGTVDPSAVADSTAGIQACLNAATQGQEVFLPAGRYLVSAPLTVPPGVAFSGEYANEVATYIDGYYGTCLIVSASWAPTTVGANTFSGVITLLGQTVPSPNYTLPNSDAKVRGIYIDGHLGPASVTGVQCFGAVTRPHFERVDVSHVTGNGFDFLNDASSNGPDAPRLVRCTARNVGGIGFNHIKISDPTYIDCLAEDGASDGFHLQNASNGKLIGCRAEENGTAGVGNGFTYVCTQSGTGSGGLLIVGCSSDRNEGNGLDISSSNNTGVPVVVAGCDFRGDGRNSNVGGANLAGIYIHSFPGTVLLTGVNTWPDVDTNGSGTPSPEIGLRLASNTPGLTNVMASSCYFQGDTIGVADDGTTLIRYAASMSATGTSASPVPSLLGLPGAGWLGSGSDGAATLDGTATVTWASKAGSVYTMTRDAQLTFLTVNSGVTLKTANFRIFCQGTLSNSGTIDNSGGAASGNTGGSNAGSKSLGSGRNGGNGGTGVSGAGQAGTSANFGGTGGAGGAGTSGASGAGGTSTQSYPTLSSNVLMTPAAVLAGTCAYAGSSLPLNSGAGGGGGGSDAASNGGGGGGAGGGIIVILAANVLNAGTISAAGGAGAAGTAGNAGGGGGGCGGVIVAYTVIAWTAGTTSVAGGGAGAGAGTGSAGSSGPAGLVLNVVTQ